MQKINSGFTLIELMIVVAIIGILASIALPQYQNHIIKSQTTEARTLMRGAQLALEQEILETGLFADSKEDLENLDINLIGKYGSITGASRDEGRDYGGGVTYQFYSDGVNKQIKGKVVRLWRNSRKTGPGPWVCATNLKQRYAPPKCYTNNDIFAFE